MEPTQNPERAQSFNISKRHSPSAVLCKCFLFPLTQSTWWFQLRFYHVFTPTAFPRVVSHGKSMGVLAWWWEGVDGSEKVEGTFFSTSRSEPVSQTGQIASTSYPGGKGHFTGVSKSLTFIQLRYRPIRCTLHRWGKDLMRWWSGEGRGETRGWLLYLSVRVRLSDMPAPFNYLQYMKNNPSGLKFILFR